MTQSLFPIPALAHAGQLTLRLEDQPLVRRPDGRAYGSLGELLVTVAYDAQGAWSVEELALPRHGGAGTLALQPSEPLYPFALAIVRGQAVRISAGVLDTLADCQD